MSLAVALLTVSDTRTLAEDQSGRALVQRLEAAGHRLHERAIVPDDRYRIRAEVSRWIADPAVQVVISNGGTVANSSGFIGYYASSSNNSALVTGTNSRWTNNADL